MTRRVVITGMGAVTSLGPDVKSLWQGLKEGRSAVRRISHFDVRDYPVQIAAEALDIPEVNWGTMAGRVHRMARAAAEQAWRDARVKDGERCGLGLSLGWENQGISGGETHPQKSSLPLLQGAGEFRKHFDLRGPLSGCFSACAAGTQLIEEGVRSIRMGEADIFLTGASDSRIHPLGLWGYARLGALTVNFNHEPEKASRPFAKNRSGFVMGEGAGFVVLEEKEKAESRGAKIYAEILGAASTNDAYSITAPAADGTAAARSITRSLERAGVRPEEVDYINAHGTSTPANDAAEVRALELALGSRALEIPVGSFKSMIGHLAMASGIVEIIGTVLAMNHGILPPNLNLGDPEFSLNFSGPHARALSLRRVLKTSFGFGGQNSSILLGSAQA